MLTIQNLSVNYGESSILNDIDMEIPPGQVICLMGRNGVGKTTLMKSIMGLLKPRRGSMLFNGENMTSWATSQRARAGFGYVPQGRGIFPYLTVYENLLMGFESTADRRVDAEALDEVYATFPVLKEMRSRMAGTLSGGQQQQLAFGRVMVRRPTVLLLDEPTEGIQPSIIKDMARTLKRIRDERGLSIVVSEQVLSFALDVADRVLVIENGEIVRDDPREGVDAAQISKYLSV